MEISKNIQGRLDKVFVLIEVNDLDPLLGILESGGVGTAVVVGSQMKPIIPKSIEKPVSVYRSFNEATGETNYVGITNSVPRRFREHLRDKNIRIEPIAGLENLPKNDARFVEQALIELHELGKNGGTLINRINSIGEKNPIKAEAVRKGLEILKAIEYDGMENIIE